MQERFYVGAGRGQGATAPKPQPCPQSISIGYRCKTVYGLQNMLFPTWALPRTPLGELTTRTLDHLVGWGGDTPLHTHSTRRLDSPAFSAVHSASRFEGHCPRQIFSSSTASPGVSKKVSLAVLPSTMWPPTTAVMACSLLMLLVVVFQLQKKQYTASTPASLGFKTRSHHPHSAGVLFKLSNFNSVTVIISYWFLRFSYQTLQ